MKYILFILSFCSVFSLHASEQEVSLQRDFGMLHGTLRTPDGGSDVAALIIAGSGPTDRNCNSPYAGLTTNSFAYLAEALEQQGIASLRYDKRGIAASRFYDPKKMYDVTFDDYIADAAAWIVWLRGQGFKKVVLVGHSEGSLIALCVAAGKTAVENGGGETADNSARTEAEMQKKTEADTKTVKITDQKADKTASTTENTKNNAETNSDKNANPAGGTVHNAHTGIADGIVLLTGAGFPLDEVLLTQLSAQLAPDNIGLLMRATATINSLRQGKTIENYPRELEMLFLPYLQRYLISQIKYKPQELIGRVGVPTLIVGGDNDIQVSVANAEALKRAKPDAELLVIGGMTHVLKQSQGRDIQGQRGAYTDIALPLDPTLSEAIPRFIRTL